MHHVGTLRLFVACGLALCTATAGCGGGTSKPAPGAVTSTKTRITAPVVAPEDALQLAADNRAFAVDLHGALRGQPGNLVYAPASVSIALAMLYGGAAGTTASEIKQALHFNLPPDRLHPAFNALDLALTAPPADGTAFRLSLVNAAWGERGETFLPTYLDLLAENYGAGPRLVDFTTAPETARLQINQWVADNTTQLIKELIPKGVIDSLTVLVLTNAVYFKADWATPFNPKSADGVFHAAAGDVSVPMMRGPETIPLWTGAGFKAASLAYVGGTTSMVVVVPDAGTFDSFEQGLTGDALGAVLDGEKAATAGALTLPRFKFNTKIDLKIALKALGMIAAFDESLADLSQINGIQDLYVSAALHQATIAVDEQGTEASAATAIVVARRSAAQNALVVDRPFLFVIRDNATGAILFQGRVVDPTQ